jgi:heat-inducible transcriptional repressor
VRRASEVLSDHTGQLGFVLAPRLPSLKLRRVSLLRLSTDSLLVVLVSQGGHVHQRVIEDTGNDDQLELEQMATLLNARVDGFTLAEVRDSIERELSNLRSEAERLRRRALALALRAFDDSVGEPSDLVVASAVVLLDHPEFHDPERVREIMSALETRERLIDVLDEILGDEVSVALGDDLGDTGLRHCALVAAPYGPEDHPVGALGVIGPSRMDYGRIIPLVSYTSRLITKKLRA